MLAPPVTQAGFLTGGPGADRFVFADADDSRATKATLKDTITDFNPRQGDRIDLRKMDGNVEIVGKQKLRFIGSKRFSHRAGEMRFVRSKKFRGGYLMIDVIGDGKADFSVKVMMPARGGSKAFRKRHILF